MKIQLRKQGVIMSSPRTIFETHILKIIDHTPIVRELILETENLHELLFRAGQFVMLQVPQKDDKPVARAYSVASSDQIKNRFHLLFKYVENGKASNYVWSLQGHEKLQFTGPFGRLFFQEPPTEQVVFLNTGTGIAQHYSYLISKAQQYPHVQYRMLFGIRTDGDIYYQKELNELTQLLPNFKYEFVLSQPSSHWNGKKGYIQNYLKEFNYTQLPTTFYLCGNGGMVKAVKHQLIEEENFSKERIWAEVFH